MTFFEITIRFQGISFVVKFRKLLATALFYCTVHKQLLITMALFRRGLVNLSYCLTQNVRNYPVKGMSQLI